jgi:hypothetical protein
MCKLKISLLNIEDLFHLGLVFEKSHVKENKINNLTYNEHYNLSAHSWLNVMTSTLNDVQYRHENVPNDSYCFFMLNTLVCPFFFLVTTLECKGEIVHPELVKAPFCSAVLFNLVYLRRGSRRFVRKWLLVYYNVLGRHDVQWLCRPLA